MSDFDVLRSRVDDAADTLTSSEAERYRQSEALTGLLSQLEGRFAAQQQELEYYKARIPPLEETNRQLAALLDRVLAMIDQGFGEATIAPLRDAAAHAARILEHDLGVPVREAGADGEVAETAAGFQGAGEAASDNGPYFENVGEVELAAEDELEAAQDSELPDVVAEAHRAAAAQADADTDVIAAVIEAIGPNSDEVDGGGSAQAPDTEIDSMDSLVEQLAAETAGLEGDETGPLDIRSLLTRVEAAAGEARSRAGPSDGTDEIEARRSAVA